MLTVRDYLGQMHFRLADERVSQGSTQYRGSFPGICVTKNVLPTGLGYQLFLFVHRGRHVDLRYRRERPPPPPLGENSTASTDRGHTADLFIASFLPAGVTHRADPPSPAGRIRRRGAFTLRPKGPDGSHPTLGDRVGPLLNPYPPPLHNSVLHDRGGPFPPE